jgi:hypothetical protein
MSVDGMALLMSNTDCVRVGDVWQLRVNEKIVQAFVARVQPQGLFFRVGVTYT